MKICEYCKEEYTPNIHGHTVQKYCNRNCKAKAGFHRDKLAGKKRKRKGGYNRTTYILCWIKAQEQDRGTAPCFYCGARLEARGDWVLDHMEPLSSLETVEEQLSGDNLVVCCKECNIKKGKTPFAEYMKMIR